MGDPSTDVADVIPTTLSEVTEPETTWYRRIFLSAAGSLRRPSSVPAGSAAKAASVGAKTVKGPSPWSVPTSPAAVAAARRVLNDPASVAVATMSLAMAAVDADGAMLGAAAVAEAGAWVGAAVGATLGVAALEQAAIAIASAGTRMAMERFMTGYFLSVLDGRRGREVRQHGEVFSTKYNLSSRPRQSQAAGRHSAGRAQRPDAVASVRRRGSGAPSTNVALDAAFRP